MTWFCASAISTKHPFRSCPQIFFVEKHSRTVTAAPGGWGVTPEGWHLTIPRGMVLSGNNTYCIRQHLVELFSAKQFSGAWPNQAFLLWRNPSHYGMLLTREPGFGAHNRRKL
jgi:hypothetical protein